MRFYKEGLDHIIELNCSGVFFAELYAATILTKMLTPFEPGYVDLMSPAGAGIAAAVYNYDGDVYASDEARMLAEMGDKTFRLGNVHENTYEEIFLNDTLLEALEASFAGSAPMCSECAFEPFCGSDPVYHHATQGDFVGRKPTSAFCRRNMAIFRHLIKLMRSDDGVRRIFLSWVGA
jgi:radical SAM protein with 4Fe4S-binding SPASM domain